MSTIEVTITGPEDSVRRATEVVDKALTAAGMPPHTPRRLHLVQCAADGEIDVERPVHGGPGGAA